MSRSGAQCAHSGITLAAIIGEVLAQEITGGGTSPLTAPYRPDRFAAGS